ncbi:MAG TPA: Rieske (2Fe-2S) protein [Spirillospora sp.]
MPQESGTRTDEASRAQGGDRAADRTRRSVLLGAGAVGIAGLAAACGGSGDGGDSGGSGGAEGGSGGSGGGQALASVSEIPVGGGKVFEDAKVVVCQPTQGQFKAFSAVCTHRGCSVDAVADGLINCPCHKSKFKITDGSVAAPPADKPLEEKQITVQGDQIMLA